MSSTLYSSRPKNTCLEAVPGEQHLTDTPPSSPQVSKLAPVAAHLVPLPDSRPSTPDLRDKPPGQSPSSTLSPQETGGKNTFTPDIAQDSDKIVEQVGFAFFVPPNVRPVTEHCSWSRPPPFSVQAGEAIVNERLRKAFCAETRRPRFPLRSHAIPTPGSFEKNGESLEACRAELKRAGYSYCQIEGSNGYYRANQATGIWEIQLTADCPLPLKDFPTGVIRVCHKERDSTGNKSTKVVSFVAHQRVLAAFFAHLGPKLQSSVPVSRNNDHSTALVQSQWLPVLTVSNAKPDVYEVLLEYVYEQNPEAVLRSLLGDRVFPQVLPCTEEIYQGTARTISALPIAERRAAVQIQEEHTYDEIVNVFAYLDEIFNLADELGLESPAFWNALASVRRIVLDAGAISYLYQLKAMADAEAAKRT